MAGFATMREVNRSRGPGFFPDAILYFMTPRVLNVILFDVARAAVRAFLKYTLMVYYY